MLAFQKSSLILRLLEMQFFTKLLLERQCEDAALPATKPAQTNSKLHKTNKLQLREKKASFGEPTTPQTTPCKRQQAPQSHQKMVLFKCRKEPSGSRGIAPLQQGQCRQAGAATDARDFPSPAPRS